MSHPTPAYVARRFHEHYERLAPTFGYKTREDSAVSWDAVPETNKALMIAVACWVMHDLGVPLNRDPARWHKLSCRRGLVLCDCPSDAQIAEALKAASKDRSPSGGAS